MKREMGVIFDIARNRVRKHLGDLHFRREISRLCLGVKSDADIDFQMRDGVALSGTAGADGGRIEEGR